MRPRLAAHRPRLAALAALGVMIACEGSIACERPPAPSEAVAPGPDCTALLAIGTRALGCDPQLGPLMSELRASPDELRCRGAARLLLDPPALARGRVVSVYERPPAPDPAPLTADEHAALADMVLPGTLILVPDLAPGPGVPNTTATLDGVALGSDTRGQLSSTWAPGEHLLIVRHADRETQACVTLRACESLTLTAHGGSLAPHPALRPGPCEGP